MPSQRSADNVRAATESSVPSAGVAAEMWRSRLQLETPFKDVAASAHSCDDEGKEDDIHFSCNGAAATERGGAASGL